MTNVVKKTIFLPVDLVREVEAIAESKGVTFSGVIQDALCQLRIERRRQALRGLQGYWRRRAREKGLFTAAGLDRYLRNDPG
ncbi:MAG: hypothetical protein FJY44_08695 [Betaproteobacteria bacterium]|nr:hypothetical protein [Betaproteobacteria bacterium]